MQRRDWSGASDTELFAAAADGDGDAFGELHRRHAPVLRWYAFRLLDDHHESEDVVSEVFTNLWLRRLSLGSVSEGRAYLFRCVRNACLNILKARRRRPRLDEFVKNLSGEPRRPDEVYLEHWACGCVRKALNRLPPEQREALYLRDYAGLSLADSAEAMALSVASFRRLLTRARRNAIHALSECWKNWLERE